MNDLSDSCFIGRSKRWPQSDFFPHLLQGTQVRSLLQMELLRVKEEISRRGVAAVLPVSPSYEKHVYCMSVPLFTCGNLFPAP